MIDHGPSYDQTHKAAMVAQCLLGAFLWRDTKEGYTYWEAVYDRLVAIAKGEALQPNSDDSLKGV